MKSAMALRLAERLAAASDRIRRAQRRSEAGDRIGLMAIAKNESLNIPEWIEHYRWQGVEKIFFIDNGSDDETRQLVETCVHEHLMEYFWRPDRHQQAEHYREVYSTADISRKVDWLVMADLDEFWYSPLGTLKMAIDRLKEDADLIYSNWLVFGSSGHVDHPRSLRKELLYRQPALGRHCNTKWICRTQSILAPKAIDVHKVRWIDSRRVASENELLKLNHYVTQSVRYFESVKMKRGDVSNAAMDSVRTWEYFNSYDAGATVRDSTLADMLSSVEPAPRVLR